MLTISCFCNWSFRIYKGILAPLYVQCIFWLFSSCIQESVCLLINLICIEFIRHLHVYAVHFFDKYNFDDPDLCATPEIPNYKGGGEVGVPWVSVLSCSISSDYASC